MPRPHAMLLLLAALPLVACGGRAVVTDRGETTTSRISGLVAAKSRHYGGPPMPYLSHIIRPVYGTEFVRLYADGTLLYGNAQVIFRRVLPAAERDAVLSRVVTLESAKYDLDAAKGYHLGSPSSTRLEHRRDGKQRREIRIIGSNSFDLARWRPLVPRSVVEAARAMNAIARDGTPYQPPALELLAAFESDKFGPSIPAEAWAFAGIDFTAHALHDEPALILDPKAIAYLTERLRALGNARYWLDVATSAKRYAILLRAVVPR